MLFSAERGHCTNSSRLFPNFGCIHLAWSPVTHVCAHRTRSLYFSNGTNTPTTHPSNPTNPHSPHCHFPFFRLPFCSGHSLLCLSTKSRKICSLPQHNSGCILLLHIVFFVACYNFLLARMNEVNFGNG